MKPAMARTKGQVYSVGNYLMNGKVLGKGHFARVEEATHRIIGKKVAIKIIDLTCIKEEYARRNLHREPKVMARLRHPCIAALYETMMHGPRLYVVMEAAGGGDLCAHVLSARGAAGGTRGLPETRARHLSVQLVSAVRHMHARGVVHRDLKMENIMLDSTKQFIKIVDFGLSNVWSASGGLRTPCGSLEYAAPELFLDGRRYGPEVDLWSVGVIVYGMVTGSLPFGGAAGNCAGGEGEGRSRPQLRAAISRGFSRKHKAALIQLSAECKAFVQHLLEPVVENRMKIEEAARHRWLRKPGLRLQAHPLPDLDLKNTRLIARQISELSGQSFTDIIAEIKADPYGSVGGMYNIKTHTSQLQSYGTDMLWSAAPDAPPRPASPPAYRPARPAPGPAHPQPIRQITDQPNIHKLNPHSAPIPPCKLNPPSAPTPPCKLIPSSIQNTTYKAVQAQSNTTTYRVAQAAQASVYKQTCQATVYKTVSLPNGTHKQGASFKSPQLSTLCKAASSPKPFQSAPRKSASGPEYNPSGYRSLPTSPAYPQSPAGRPGTVNVRGPAGTVRKPLHKAHDNGDGAEPRLPSIDEHGKPDDKYSRARRADEDRLRVFSCPDRAERRTEFYRRAGDGLPRNIVSPHSSTNSHCKSERGVSVGWYARNSKEPTTPLRLRRTAPIK